VIREANNQTGNDERLRRCYIPEEGAIERTVHCMINGQAFIYRAPLVPRLRPVAIFLRRSRRMWQPDGLLAGEWHTGFKTPEINGIIGPPQKGRAA